MYAPFAPLPNKVVNARVYDDMGHLMYEPVEIGDIVRSLEGKQWATIVAQNGARDHVRLRGAPERTRVSSNNGKSFNIHWQMRELPRTL